MDPFTVLAEPNRRKILRLIWEEEKPAGEIADAFDVTFGAISQHLAVLREIGFVSVRRAGNRRMYKTNRDALGPHRTVLEEMWTMTLDALAKAVEADDE